MGREIRRVILNWEHPRRDCPHTPWTNGCDEAKVHNGKCYQPMYDRDYKSASDEWKAAFLAWENGERQARLAKDGEDYEYWDWNGMPPDKDYYRQAWTAEEATWYQVYQTVSEGSPVTPPFATQEELVDYLVENGDFWDQRRGHGGWNRETAERFVGIGWAPSLISANGQLSAPRDGIPASARDSGTTR